MAGLFSGADMSQYIRDEIERIVRAAHQSIEDGVTEPIVAALRAKGWTCTPPEEAKAHCPGCGRASGFGASVLLPGNEVWHHDCYQSRSDK